jgi:hypothetical protein
MAGKSLRWIVCFLAGMLVMAVPCGAYLLNKGHHYSELGSFFKGSVGDRQVVGVAFVEYDGLGMMELTQWKVELMNRSGQRVTLYRKSSVFQEKTPHQPTVKISGREIQIDDGEDKIAITVQEDGKSGG